MIKNELDMSSETFFYEAENKKKRIDIYKDDVLSFLRKLPSNSIDIITTDPAYSGMNNKLKLGKGRIVGKYDDKGKANAKWFNEFEDTEENYHEFLKECKRVLRKETGHIYIMFDSFSLLTLGALVREYFDVKNLLVWNKVNIGMGHYFRRRHELIVFATNGNTRKVNSRSLHDIWDVKRLHNAKYPTQKPVEVFGRMLEASSQPDFTICDPFLGSGSAAIAAIQYNCNFIGCDISEQSFDLCKQRIHQFINHGNDILEKGTLNHGIIIKN